MENQGLKKIVALKRIQSVPKDLLDKFQTASEAMSGYMEWVRDSSVNIGAFNENGQLVGFASGDKDKVARHDNAFVILGLYVLPEYRGLDKRGLTPGQRLIYRMLGEAKKLGRDPILMYGMRPRTERIVNEIVERGHKNFGIWKPGNTISPQAEITLKRHVK